MSSNFQKAINIIREKANNETEKGNAFEKLSKIYLENDDVQKQFFKKVWHYREWAKDNPKFSQTDIGIDLVAELKEGGLAAIQAKCYDSNHTISKDDMDSFISASSNDIFKRLILIDTSNNDLGPNAKKVIETLNKQYLRIQKSELEGSRIQWLTYLKEDKVVLEDKKDLKDHQRKALNAAEKYFKDNDRGKMIMACGTGKTFTSLRITEKLAGKGKFVLYMVPSLALMSQTIREWKNDCIEDFEAFSACSDKKVGKKKASDDEIIINLNDLSFPATTDSKKLASEIKKADSSKLIVVFSTYQSIDVVSKAQNEHGLRKFDLILCDEAHRTTGATLSGEDESHFVRVHSDDHIIGKKRLYMTATPRIYGEKAKQKADQGEAELASMDDKDVYGETFYTFGFNDAVEDDLLTDYKVVILAIDEEKVSETLQKSFEEGSELKLDEATKIIGCYKALAKVGFEQNKLDNKKNNPIKRALAFTQSINISKIIQNEFKNVVEDYLSNEKVEEKYKVDLDVEIEHVDGSFSADKRNEKLNWLKEDTEANNCRILTNVKCLSEGVDVPTLDAIMFLHPRKSQIDVVQSVGRVMRKAHKKDMGYVIIPITVAPGIAPERALNDSDRYRVVWQILNALRSHDERMDSAINRIGLGEEVSDKIQIIGMDTETENITSVVDDVKPKQKKKKKEDKDSVIGKEQLDEKDDQNQEEWVFEIGDLSKAIKAKIVEKCGTRDYWENWAADIAKIAQTHITRLNGLLVKKNSEQRKVFDKFLEEIRDDLNPEITESDAVEMLAQHIITKPVFETLFQGNDFTKDNPISKAIENILNKIYDTNIDVETDSLEKFYASVRRKAQDIISSKSRTALLNQLYERFFKNAFPKTTDKLGIVYTPIEVVDFINNSVEQILKKEFGKSLNDQNIHILDPFTGTGTFIVRLIESGLIKKEKLLKKYISELHANEIVLLAYYMACINIESAFHDILKPNQYTKFDGGVLTDTFQLYEQERDMIADLLPDNSKKRTNQKKRDIRVIIGNPPYSAGQTSANDETKNVSYPNLDNKIKDTYATFSRAANIRNLYDSYIRSFRWASDRIGEEGVIGFITNASWIDGLSTDGFRKVVKDEFSKIYILHLRGNQRTAGELSRKEGGKIFGAGSRSPIAITFLIKKKNSKECDINFYDIGDYLKRDEKLKIIRNFQSIENVEKLGKFKKIIPDENNDWINKSNPDFKKFFAMGSKKKSKDVYFENYSCGYQTGRDSWCYNFSKDKLIKNIKNFISFYNSELERVKNLDKSEIENKLSYDKSKIAWSGNLIEDLKKQKKIKFNEKSIRKTVYRPFVEKYAYLDNDVIQRRFQMQNIFPNNNSENYLICISGTGARNGFGVLALNKITDLHFLESGGQCFPMYLYEKNEMDIGLFKEKNVKNELRKKEAVTNFIQNKFIEKLQKKINKNEIFYYIFGVLNSPSYVKKYHTNLEKELPRIPIPKKYELFKTINSIGRQIFDLQTSVNDNNKYLFSNDKELKEKFKKLRQIDSYKLKKDEKNKKFSLVINNTIKLLDIDTECLNLQNKGKSMIENFLSYAKFSMNKDTKISDNIINFDGPDYVYEKIKSILYISKKTSELKNKLSDIEI